jgi:predicted nucleic acid-binding protein
MKKFLDINIFLRFIDGEKSSGVFFNDVIKGKETYWVQTLVVSELVWVLGSQYKWNNEKIADYVGGVLRTNNLKWTSECDLCRAIEWFGKMKVKYNDCLIVSAMGDGDTIVSFDHEFNRFPWIKRVEPKDLFGK